MRKFDVNYYDLLELDPELDAQRDRAQITDRIVNCEQQWRKDLNAFQPTTVMRAKLGLATLGQMKADLQNNVESWAEQSRLRKKTLVEAATEAAIAANEILDVLDSGSLDERMKTALVELVGNASTVDAALARRKLTVTGNTTPQLDKTARTDYDTVMKARESLAPLLRQLKHATVYDLIREHSGDAVTSSAPVDAVMEALGKMKKANSSQSQRDRSELFTAVFDVMSKMLGRKLPGGSEPSVVKTLFDRLLAFDQAAHLEAFLRKRVVARLDGVQFQRLVKLGQDRTSLDEAMVGDHFMKLCLLANINLAPASTSEACVVCAYCATLNAATAKSCTACGQSLFEECFNCGKLYVATRRRCPSCGVSDAVSVQVRAAMARGQAHLASYDLSAAATELAIARTLTPQSDGLKKLDNAITIAQRHIAQRIADLNRLVEQRKMHSAQVLLGELGSCVDEATRRRCEQQLTSAIERANELTSRARSEATQTPERAIELLSQALAAVDDHASVQQVIAMVSPVAPRNLQGTVMETRVRIAWDVESTPSWASCIFQILRGVGHAPTGSSDGAKLGETSDSAWTDADCPHGQPVYYTVLAKRPGGSSRAAANIGPLYLLPPARELRVTPLEVGYKFQWTLPAAAQDTAIYRIPPVGDPKSVPAGAPIAVAKSEWNDATLTSRQPFRYMFVARYAVPGAGLRCAEPLWRDVAATLAPSAVTKVELKDPLQLIWSPPPLVQESDHVHVFEVEPSLARLSGILRAEEMLPALISLPAQRTGRFDLELYGDFWLVVVRQREDLRRCSTAIHLRHVAAVEDLRLEPAGTGAEASWNWPTGCTLATVGFFADNSELGTREIRRDRTQRGRCVLEQSESRSIEVSVTALSADRKHRSEARRAKTTLRARNKLSFRVMKEEGSSLPRWLKSNAREAAGISLRLRLEEAERMPAFEVRFSPDFPPSASDGRRLTMQERTTDSIHGLDLDLGSLLKGQRGFINVCLLDSGEAARITVVPLECRV